MPTAPAPHSQTKSPVVLLVDDDPDDLFFMQNALQRAGIPYLIKTVSSGLECIDYLVGDPPFDDRQLYPFPTLLLLDINMPGMDGFEVLDRIRRNPQFAKLPVAMLTRSDDIPDVNRAYRLGANSFLVKSADFTNPSQLSTSLQRLLAKSQAD
jgi:CheY-like chemotaxis protein